MITIERPKQPPDDPVDDCSHWASHDQKPSKRQKEASK